MSKSQHKDEDKFEIIDKLFDLKLSIKQAEMDRDWSLRQKLIEELEETKKIIEPK